MGKLVQVATETVTSAVGYVDLIGTTTDDVYMVTYNNLFNSGNNNTNISCRFLVSSSPDISSNYDWASKTFRANNTFGNSYNTNIDRVFFDVSNSWTTNNTAQGIHYIYNANNSSEYTFLTFETAFMHSTLNLYGNQGGAVLTVAQATNGIRYFFDTGNITSGTFTLYKVL